MKIEECKRWALDENTSTKTGGTLLGQLSGKLKQSTYTEHTSAHITVSDVCQACALIALSAHTKNSPLFCIYVFVLRYLLAAS